VGNVTQDLDAWMVSHVEQIVRGGDPSDPDATSTSTSTSKSAGAVEDEPIVIQPERKLSSEPEPDVRFCDEITMGSMRHHAKSHFRTMLVSAAVLSVSLAVISGFELNHKAGASAASFEIPSVVVQSGLGIQGDYVATPAGQFPVMLSLRQDGRDLRGTMTTSVLDEAKSPEAVQSDSIVVTGFVDRSNVEMFFRANTLTSYEGVAAGSSITLQMSGSPVVFEKQTAGTFDSLVARDSAYVLAESAGPSDNLAKWNLDTAIQKAGELSFVSKGDLANLASFGDFTTHLVWTDGSCTTSGCVSFALVDNDRGVVLATYSPASGSCWYAKILPGSATSFAKSAKPGTCRASTEN